jgi:hypothetical protein
MSLLAGIGSFAFGWAIAHRRPRFDARSLLDFACRHALDVVQLGDNLPLHNMPAHRRVALVIEARRIGIQLEVGARGLTEAHLATNIDVCHKVGATLLRFVIDVNGYAPTPKQVGDIVRNALPALAAANVTLALEDHDRFTAGTLRSIVDEVASEQVGGCLDLVDIPAFTLAGLRLTSLAPARSLRRWRPQSGSCLRPGRWVASSFRE